MRLFRTRLLACAAASLMLVGCWNEEEDSAAEEKVSILSVRLETSKDRKFRFTITFETAESTHVQHIMKRLNRLPGVYEVRRVRS